MVKEAFGRFKQLRSGEAVGSPRVSGALIDEWLLLFDKVAKNRGDWEVEDHAKVRIGQLEQQLRQAQDDLKSDEEIFADKEKEMAVLKERLGELEDKLHVNNRYIV